MAFPASLCWLWDQSRDYEIIRSGWKQVWIDDPKPVIFRKEGCARR